MRRILCCLGLLFATVLMASLLKPAPVSAITYGFVDTNNTYSNAGAFIVKSPSGEIYPICSGTLITADVSSRRATAHNTSRMYWNRLVTRLT